MTVDTSLQPIDPESVHKVRLSSDVAMPVAAFGTFHSDWAQEHMYQATLEAIRLGWRHLDTARAYENEALIGAAIKESVRLGYISSVEDLFITGKLWNGHMNPKDVLPALEGTLTALGIDQIDMYLNHWPWPNAHVHGAGTEFRNSDAVPYIHDEFMDTWEELCKAKRAGKVVDIGTSNHTAACMKLLLRDTGIAERPSCNQMEMHPLMQQTALRREFESEKILCTGYMSLGSPNRPARDRFDEHLNDLDNTTLCELASELGVSPARVALSWAAQRENGSGGYVAMSTTPKRIHENLLAATDDLLSPEQLLRISGDGSEENQGIDMDNRLIWGQVFLWPEAAGDWKVLWNDSQVFESRSEYDQFKLSL